MENDRLAGARNSVEQQFHTTRDNTCPIYLLLLLRTNTLRLNGMSMSFCGQKMDDEYRNLKDDKLEILS